MTKLPEKSPLFRNGLREGDRLIVIDGKNITDMSNAINLLNSLKGKKEIKIRYFSKSNNEEKEVKLKL